VEPAQKERLAAVRAARDPARVRTSLDRLEAAAHGDGNLMSLIVEATRSRASVGEISDCLRRVFGAYDG
jgi:methylmalonyl-CoA mutase N-terminal domain/subunit